MGRMFTITFECAEDQVGALIADNKKIARVVSMDVVETKSKYTKSEPPSKTMPERMLLILRALTKMPLTKGQLVEACALPLAHVGYPLGALKDLRMLAIPKGTRGALAVNTLTETGKKLAQAKDANELEPYFAKWKKGNAK